jgi:tRNA uridine 5-carbamoylmethylation protein Kti12
MNENNLMHINSNNIGRMDTTSEYQQLFINNIIGTSTNSDLMKAHRQKVINCEVDNIENIWLLLEEKYNLYSTSEYRAVIDEDEFIAIINWQYQSSLTGLTLRVLSSSISSCKKYIEEIQVTLSDLIVVDEALVSYTILQNDNSETLNETFYQDTIEVDFNPVATPFIEDVNAYIEKFLNSKAPVLILQGEPGTGKTTFVKYLLQTMQSKVQEKREDFKAMYSFDENIFYLSDFYKRIIYDDYDVLVLEDINEVLYKNQDEDKLNPINKFLSVTDGLISKYKKIIITTNIESKHHINQALLRPGRCYDVIPFRKLEGIEIDNLCDSCAKYLYLQTESINLSEFYAKCNNEKNTQVISSRVGF